LQGPEARQHIETAAKIDLPQQSICALGLIIRNVNLPRRKMLIAQALSINPVLVPLQHNLGFSYCDANKFVLAGQHFESALALNPAFTYE